VAARAVSAASEPHRIPLIRCGVRLRQPQIYANYGRSHMYLGAEILIMVILILVVGNNGGNAVRGL
jgi:hypothetical protein